MTYAAVAQRAVQLAGKYSGCELPHDINPRTRTSATALAGSGLMGVAKDTLPVGGETAAFACAFAEVEVDLETGQHRIVDILNVGDCGTVIHPMGLAARSSPWSANKAGLDWQRRISARVRLRRPASAERRASL